MKHLFAAISIAWLALLPTAARGWDGVVSAVVEGDVIKITSPEGTLTVKVAGAACPRGGQDYSKLSRRFTSQMALRVRVSVEEIRRDGGTVVARVVLPKGRGLAEALVGAGMAWWDQRNHPELALLGDLERAARDRAAGLWFDDQPVAPWEWSGPEAASPEALPEAAAAEASSGADASAEAAGIPVIQPTRIR